jgi:2,3-dihydroxybenzoate decarboxylase
VKKNPSRFGALAALSMHDPQQAAGELTRAVKQLGMFGGLVNDFQSTAEDASGKEYYDTEKYLPFWKQVEELNVPIYFHPRWPPPRELEPTQPYGARKHLLGAAVSFHLDLSFHIYAMCASGSCFSTVSRILAYF